MAKVKGIKKLCKAVSAQLKPFGITAANLSTEYSYVFADGSVTFKITEGSIEDIWFNEFIEERFGYHVENTFIISLLHEIGHAKANWEIEGALQDFCLAEKERISEGMYDNADNLEVQKILEWQYFNLPDEIMATAWAVNYAKEHPKRIRKMWKQFEKAFHDFYEKNLDKEEFI
jgi:hypothetical protein